MSRILSFTVLLAGLTAAAFSQTTGRPAAGKPGADKQPASKAAPPTALSLVETLLSTVDFPGYDDPKVTLGDALEQLGRQHHVTFDVNEKAFQHEGLAEVLKTLVANPAVPPMRTTFRKVLARIIARVHVPSTATFLVRDDCIEITTNQFVQYEFSLIREHGKDRKGVPYNPVTGQPLNPLDDDKGGVDMRLYVPVVSIAVERQPLEEALRQMRLQTTFNIVLDPGLGEKAKTKVTLTLLNAPFDSAMRVLTEMTELDSVWLDNIFYITNRDKAQKLRAAWPERRSGGRVPIITAVGGGAGM